jgi:hypothetical protein
MSDAQLFSWPVKERRTRSKKPAPALVERRPNHALIHDHRGHGRFHIVATARGSIVVAWCGVTGHRVDEDAPLVVECVECVKASRKTAGR